MLLIDGRALRARSFSLDVVEYDTIGRLRGEGGYLPGLRRAYLSADLPGGGRIDSMPVSRVSEGERASGRLIYRMRSA